MSAPVTQWLTPDEVAAALRVAKMTVYRLIHTGDLPAVRIGRSFRIDAAELAAWVSGHRTS